MTDTPHTESPQARCRAWACAQLDLPSEVTAAQARSRMLALLEEEELVPPEPWVDAYRVVAAATDAEKLRANPASFLIENERQLLEQIDEFRSTMMQLAPADRMRRWKQLTERSRSVPRAATRAELLEPAVHADLTKITEKDPYFRRLAEHAVELFGLPPQAQAIRRRNLVQEMSWEVENWESAVRQLRTMYPELAAMDPLLLDRIHGLNEDRDWAETRTAALDSTPALRSRSTPDFQVMFRIMKYALGAITALVIVVRLFSGPSVPQTRPTHAPPLFDPYQVDPGRWDVEDRPEIRITPEARERLLNMREEELRDLGGRDILIRLGLEEEWKRRQAERKRRGPTKPADGVPSQPDPAGDAPNLSERPMAAESPSDPATRPTNSP